MRIFILILLVLFSVTSTFAQKNKADSISRLLAIEKTDSNKVTLLWNMANVCNIYNPDTAMLLSREALDLARKIKFVKGESMALGIAANTFVKIGNYPRALEFYLQKLKLEEKRDDPGNMATVTMNIGVVYVYQEEYRKAIINYFKADSILTANNLEMLKYNIALNLGDVYNRINVYDSAFIFFNKSLGIAKKMNDVDLIGASMVGLGHIYLKLDSDSLALKHYTDALGFLRAANDEELICEASLGMAKLHEKLKQPDSSEFYAKLALNLAKKDGFLSFNLEASTFLAAHFKSLQKNDSALSYLEYSQSLKDSINSKERIRESQIISSNEQLRQLEIAEQKRKASEERDKQLQFLFIGIFIPGLFLITLFLSRIRVHVRLIKVMGILSLLILFEYFILLMHPYVVEFTNHTPVYEIMIFVAIASIIIPAHHRIEHWLIDKLINRKSNYTDGKFNVRSTRLKMKKPSD